MRTDENQIKIKKWLSDNADILKKGKPVIITKEIFDILTDFRFKDNDILNLDLKCRIIIEDKEDTDKIDTRPKLSQPIIVSSEDTYDI